MKLKPGQEDEYRRRHDAIWPELTRELSAAGVSDYSIYLDRRTGTLFAYQRLADHHTLDDLPNLPIMAGSGGRPWRSSWKRTRTGCRSWCRWTRSSTWTDRCPASRTPGLASGSSPSV